MTKYYACPGRALGSGKNAGSNKEKSTLKRAVLSGVAEFTALKTSAFFNMYLLRKQKSGSF